MDPYWQMVFERSEQYLKGALALHLYMYASDKEVWHKSGLVDWQAPYFVSVNPLIDFAYSMHRPEVANYFYFLNVYTMYKKQELKADNLDLKTEGKIFIESGR